MIEESTVERSAISIVPITDEPKMRQFTPRSVTLGILFALILSFANAIFGFRSNPFVASSSISILLAYPIGILTTFIPMPKENSGYMRRIIGSFNSGPFTIKEHIIIWVICSSAAGKAPYGIENVVTQKLKLQDAGATFWPSLAFVLTTQLIGYGLAGLTRRFLVKPAEMVWPSNLAVIALFRAFHDAPSDNSDRDDSHELGSDEFTVKSKSNGLSRYSFFWIATLVVFVWEFFPLYFMTVLQFVSILCFVSSSSTMTLLASGDKFEGVGMFSFTLDWSQISYYNQPLTAPFWATCNYFVSNMLWLWIVIPVVHALNAFGAPKLTSESKLRFRDSSSNNTLFPSLNTVHLFSNGSGKQLPPIDFLDSTTLSLNESFYNQHAPIYMSDAFAIQYFTNFCNFTAVLSHVFLWHGKDLLKQLREAFSARSYTEPHEERSETPDSQISDIEDVSKKAFLQLDAEESTDIHNELMQAYPDVPEWIYLTYTLVMLLVQMLVLQFTSYKLEWWATLLAFGLSSLFLIPIGCIMAITNQQFGLNIVTEFIIGLIMPGETVQVMTFKSFGYNLVFQAIALVSDLKLGHYMKISPVNMVAAQLIGTVIGAVMNTGVAFWMMDSLLPILTKFSKDWTSANYETFVNSGIIWGAIAPARMFGPGSVYKYLLLAFPIGLFVPAIPFIGNKLKPHYFWRLIHFPIIFNFQSVQYNLGAPLSNLIIGFIFQHYLFKFRYSWWDKYNYTLSVALDTATALATLVVSFLLMGGIAFPYYSLNPSTSKDYYCFADGYK